VKAVQGGYFVRDLRSHIRYDLQKEIEYILLYSDTDKTFRGVTINISEAGLGLYVFDPLERGQEISIRSDIRVLSRAGSIRWCHQLGEDVYKAGLQFIRSE
jgi:hypothetical protein